MSKWTYPDVTAFLVSTLKNLYDFDGSVDGVPYRIGGYFASNSEFVMLIGWTHNKKKYDPPSALESLQKRKEETKYREATLCEYAILTGRRTERVKNIAMLLLHLNFASGYADAMPRLRESREWTQPELAEAAGMSQPRISEIERPGERKLNWKHFCGWRPLLMWDYRCGSYRSAN